MELLQILVHLAWNDPNTNDYFLINATQKQQNKMA